VTAGTKAVCFNWGDGLCVAAKFAIHFVLKIRIVSGEDPDEYLPSVHVLPEKDFHHFSMGPVGD
jgi:hypothetical protein